MLSDAAPREARPGRPSPKHPEVLVTTAASGAGVAELLAAIDRHRSTARGADGSAARLRRAEAQVWAVLVDRLHARVRSLEGAEEVATGSPTTGPIAAGIPIVAREWLHSVASHELDPYAAADAILGQLIGGASAPEPNG
jgi:putative protein kinase ArgK-like GTPase of G3E family